MKRRIPFFLFILHLLNPDPKIFSQPVAIESLEKSIYNVSKDSSLVNSLNKLCDFYLYYLPGKAENFSLEALNIANSLNFKKGIAESYLNLAFVCYRKDQYDQQIKYIEKANEIYSSLEDEKGIGICHLRFAEAHYALGNLEGAMENCIKAQEIFESVGYSEGIGKVWYAFGTIDNEFENNNDAALIKLQKALEIQLKSKDLREAGLTLSMLGDIYLKNAKPEKGLESYLTSLDYCRKSYNRNAECYTLNSLANFYFDRQDYGEAENYFSQSLQINEEMENYFGIIRNLNGLARVRLKQNRFMEAKQFNTRCLETAKKIGDNYGKYYAYREFFNIYTTLSDEHNALKYHKLYAEMKDTVFNLKSSAKIAAMQTRSQYDKKLLEQQKENEKRQFIAEEISKRQKLYIYFIFSIALAAALVALVIFRSLLTVRKQKTTIEKQKNLVEEKNRIIEQKNKDITDSINYAQRIQLALLPKKDDLGRLFPDSFVLYKPRDIVSGDFYWISKTAGGIYVAAVDCTGHGVPGAFMSMIGNTLLNEIIIEKKICRPDKILFSLREAIIKSLKQTGAEGETKDGMDIALCHLETNKRNDKTETYHTENISMSFSGANNPLWIIRNGELKKFNGDIQPIGIYSGSPKPFTNHEIIMEKGDIFYLFTDGYADQFGGPKGKKFKTKQLESILLSIYKNPMADQRKLLEKTLEDWKNWPQSAPENMEQVDDICIIGVRI